MPDLDENNENFQVNTFWLWMAQNWRTVVKWAIPIFSTLGIGTYFTEIKENAIDVWNMPSTAIHEIRLSKTNDSTHTKQIAELYYELKRLQEENKVLKHSINGAVDICERETEGRTYKGISIRVTDVNPNTGISSAYTFVYNDKYDIKIPYELKYDAHYDGYEYWDKIEKKKIAILPRQ